MGARRAPDKRGRGAYGREDLIEAAALAALWRTLGAALATVAWDQIRGDIDDSDGRLGVVVRPATDRAVIVRRRAELDAAIARDERGFVIDLRTPINRALSMYEDFEAAHS